LREAAGRAILRAFTFFYARLYPATSLREKSGVACFVEFAARQFDDCAHCVLFACGEAIAIQFEKKDSRNKTRTLVTVDEWMVSQETGSVNRGQRDYVGRFAVRKMLLRPCQCRVQQRTITHSRCSAMQAEEAIVQR